MRDHELLEGIEKLMAEEDELRNRGHALDGAERERLRALEVRLDQLWDLSRQRSARREFHEDPAGATIRDAGTVRAYEQ